MNYGIKRLRIGEEGFTIVELLVSILVSMIVLAAISATFVIQNKSYAKQEQVVNAQENARAALQLMTKELLMAGYDPTGKAGAGIEVADSDTVRFTMDIEENEDVADTNEDITYALDTTENQVTRKSGSSGTAQPIAESIQTLTFKYFDSAGHELSSVPLNASDMAKVTRVSVKLTPLFPQSSSYNGNGSGTAQKLIRLAHAGVVRVYEVAARVLTPKAFAADDSSVQESVSPRNLGQAKSVDDSGTTFLNAADESWKDEDDSSSSSSSS